MILRILKGTFKALATHNFTYGYGDGCVSSVGLGNREARGLTLQSNDKGN